MSARIRITAVLTALVALFATGATAQEVPFTPVTPTQRVYAHCGANDKATAGESATYTWNTTAPSASVSSGAGCGQLDVSPQTNDQPVFTGTYTGNINALTVHAWVIDAGLSRTPLFTEVWTQLRLVIDGVEVVAADDVKIPPKDSETGASRLLEVSITNIGLLAETDNVEHTIELHIGSMPYDDGDTIAWVLDTTEVDTGLTFNPTTLAGLRIRA